MANGFVGGTMRNDVLVREMRDLRWRRARILNAWVDSLRIPDVLELLEEGGVLFTVNPEHLYQLQRNEEFAEAYASATFVSCDSIYVYFALKMLGRGIEYRASGSDIVPAYWKKHAPNPAVTMFLLGSRPGVAQEAGRRINGLAGREIVVGAHGPSFNFLDDERECAEVIESINSSGATCLVVGLG